MDTISGTITGAQQLAAKSLKMSAHWCVCVCVWGGGGGCGCVFACVGVGVGVFACVGVCGCVCVCVEDMVRLVRLWSDHFSVNFVLRKTIHYH